MRTLLAAAVLMLAVGPLFSAPLPRTVTSWEGAFRLEPRQVTIQIGTMPPLRMCLYRLPGGNQGTAVAFADSKGNLLLGPQPTSKGIQPIYREHFVIFAPGADPEVVVIYDVQGNGGLTAVEAFKYDGTCITLRSASYHGGRHDPVWRQGE